MDALTDDSEVSLLRQSQKNLQRLGDAFKSIEDLSSDRNLDSIIRKIEPYQEDPQLLDTHLGVFIPLLSQKYLAHLQNRPLLQRLSKILYTFCKVRGEKVIQSLLSNEARWIEPLLDLFDEGPLPWEQSYVLLTWLSHLMLTPFDLSTISSDEETNFEYDELHIPNLVPGIAARVLQIGTQRLRAATIERKAASQLLIKLCIRRDSLEMGLLTQLCNWALSKFTGSAQDVSGHSSIGLLTFLAGLVASADTKELSSHLRRIFGLSQQILDDDSLASIRGSTLARKLIIKIQRNTIVHCLQTPQHDIDTTEAVEQAIGNAVSLLSDPDTHVRMAASKALSFIAQRLDPDMAAEVVEAVNATFHEELIDSEAGSTFLVNTSKWHGVVLTLGHLIYRRAVPIEQLHSVLKSILIALDFEQKSPIGKSVGANVRDAANYGLWAIARRFTTKELQTFDARAISLEAAPPTACPIQYMALRLICAACFDSDGNVRRGSSAALQEMIGRHPTTIIERLSLVLIVDFQAVGLRARAATKVAVDIARLDSIYYQSVVEALSTWRGFAASSISHRDDAAVCVGMLLSKPGSHLDETLTNADGGTMYVHKHTDAVELLQKLLQRVAKLKTRDNEERHGLLTAASWLLSATNVRIQDGLRVLKQAQAEDLELARQLLNGLAPREDVLTTPLLAFIASPDFNARAPRTDALLAAGLRFMGEAAQCISTLSNTDQTAGFRFEEPISTNLLTKCLSRSEEILLDQIPKNVASILRLSIQAYVQQSVKLWLVELEPRSRKPGISKPARLLALGAAYGELDETGKDLRTRILLAFLDRYRDGDIETKVVVLRSLQLVLKVSHALSDTCSEQRIAASTIIALALHDYTISDRGDVGSLVRLAGLAALKTAWSSGVVFTSSLMGQSDVNLSLSETETLKTMNGKEAPEHTQVELKAAVLRLSLEKLDRVRLAATLCWNALGYEGPALRATWDGDVGYLLKYGAPLPPAQVPDHDITSPSYFQGFLNLLASPGTADLYSQSIVDGLCSTAGGAGTGASQTMVNAREALHTYLINNQAHQIAFGSILRHLVASYTEKENDQRLISILEVISFLLDIHSLQGIASTSWSWRAFLSCIQRCHFKSRNILKLQTCLDVYRGLAEVEEIKDECLRRIFGMLLHPIPAVRVTAAESLGLESEEAAGILTGEDWTKPVSALKGKVGDVGRILGV